MYVSSVLRCVHTLTGRWSTTWLLLFDQAGHLQVACNSTHRGPWAAVHAAGAPRGGHAVALGQCYRPMGGACSWEVCVAWAFA
jgi:hypothetical protein